LHRPSRESFDELAKRGNWIPVIREIRADLDTALSLFKRLDDGETSFLFESVAGAEKWARYSFMGRGARAIFRTRGQAVEWTDSGRDQRFQIEGDPLVFLRDKLAAINAAIPETDGDLPPFLGGGHMIHRVTRERSTYAESPHRFEAGTMPIAQAVGMAAALRWSTALDWTGATAHTQRLTERLLQGIGGVAGARIIGPTGLQGRTGVVSFDVPGLHPHDICQILDWHGVALRGGHHCCQVLMERFDLAGTTRASIAPYNDDADIDAFLYGLDDAVRRLA